MQTDTPQTFSTAWKERLKALRNIPPVLLMVWQSGPKIVGFNIFLRIVAALIPVALLSVTRLIVALAGTIHFPIDPVPSH